MPWWLPLALMLIPGGTLLALLIEAVTGLNKPARPSFMGWWWKVLGVQGALMVASGGSWGWCGRRPSS